MLFIFIEGFAFLRAVLGLQQNGEQSLDISYYNFCPHTYIAIPIINIHHQKGAFVYNWWTYIGMS